MRAHAERGHVRALRALVSEILCLWYNYFISKIPIKLQFEIHTKTKNLLLEQDDARLNYT